MQSSLVLFLRKEKNKKYKGKLSLDYDKDKKWSTFEVINWREHENGIISSLSLPTS